MNASLIKQTTSRGLFAFGIIALMGCPVWRTEHKVETTHKIDAHIVVDVRKVQEEAEQIESEVNTGAVEGQPSAMNLGAEPPFRVASAERPWWSIFDVSTPAYAQGGDKASAIASRKARAAEVVRARSTGCVGENALGFAELRPCDGDNSQYRGLIDAENADRRAIYEAIALEQGLSANQANVIGEIFAREIRNELRSGQPFQVPSTNEHYEHFLTTPLGKQLPNARKGEWVLVP